MKTSKPPCHLSGSGITIARSPIRSPWPPKHWVKGDQCRFSSRVLTWHALSELGWVRQSGRGRLVVARPTASRVPPHSKRHAADNTPRLSELEMSREPIPTWHFAVVVVRRGDQFLIIQETAHQQHWFLPAGRLEHGESFAACAMRETLEESGLMVDLLGVIRVEHTPSPTGARTRVVFLAKPSSDGPLKTTPDEHSLGAKWVTVGQVADHPLRSQEVEDLIAFVHKGGAIYPLDVLATESTPYNLR
jgi:ADP-ribose pyrophosphatase YjhB (NUDIX family)